MIGLQTDFFLLSRFLLVLVLFNTTSSCCCFALSIIFEDQSVGLLVATLVMLFEMLFGGLLLNKNSVASAFKWIYSFSFFNYAFEALVVNEVAKLTLVEEKFGFKVDVSMLFIVGSWCCYFTNFWIKSARVLERRSFPWSDGWYFLRGRLFMAAIFCKGKKMNAE
jgi:hypothetical protein